MNELGFKIHLQVICKDENKYSSGVSLVTIVSGLYNSTENRIDTLTLTCTLFIYIYLDMYFHIYISKNGESHMYMNFNLHLW